MYRLKKDVAMQRLFLYKVKTRIHKVKICNLKVKTPTNTTIPTSGINCIKLSHQNIFYRNAAFSIKNIIFARF